MFATPKFQALFTKKQMKSGIVNRSFFPTPKKLKKAGNERGKLGVASKHTVSTPKNL